MCAQQDLVTADAGEGPVVVDAVAVVHRHPGETGQHTPNSLKLPGSGPARVCR